MFSAVFCATTKVKPTSVSKSTALLSSNATTMVANTKMDDEISASPWNAAVPLRYNNRDSCSSNIGIVLQQSNHCSVGTKRIAANANDNADEHSMLAAQAFALRLRTSGEPASPVDRETNGYRIRVMLFLDCYRDDNILRLLRTLGTHRFASACRA